MHMFVQLLPRKSNGSCVCITCLTLHGSHPVLGLRLLLSTGQNTLFPVLNCNKQAAASSDNKAGGCLAVELLWLLPWQE